ncbi:DUF2955 domain-containing protein [Vibrio sp. ZSDE26]|uniref:DUF2955 domain-containing protein n=1 Tax=Vibrio amylolyticus TaxID=2847292 RepID=A0A9X2BH17_9VIBR|nr:DUF2955 domain-containing protein [Vibrio amylolyticus]MCK6263481.1 DUF2955 domain-containing protein [Vibrio amylolyticus]
MKALRIWFGCSLGLAISMVLGWDFGFLTILMPLFVLGKIDHFHLPAMIMIFAAAVWTSLQITLLWEFFNIYPVILFILVGVAFLINSIAMTNQKTFLIGYMGLLLGSILLNFSSYTFMDIEELSITIIVACIANIVICSIAHWLFPEPEGKPSTEEPKQAAPESDSAISRIEGMTQVAMVWSIAMFAFVVFQVFDLYDSAAANASILIILAPMTCIGILQMAKIRIIGTALGCVAGLAVQLTLGLWFENPFLYWLLFTIAMGPFCYWQTQGIAKAALSLSAMAALCVPLTSALAPGESDAVFSILYRFSSIFIAVILSVLVMLCIQYVFDRTLPKPNISKRTHNVGSNQS